VIPVEHFVFAKLDAPRRTGRKHAAQANQLIEHAYKCRKLPAGTLNAAVGVEQLRCHDCRFLLVGLGKKIDQCFESARPDLGIGIEHQNKISVGKFESLIVGRGEALVVGVGDQSHPWVLLRHHSAGAVGGGVVNNKNLGLIETAESIVQLGGNRRQAGIKQISGVPANNNDREEHPLILDP